jgi:hypothetical protein
MDKTLTIKISDCMRKVTLKVRITGLNVLKVRLFFSTQLIKLSALIAGCGLDIETIKNEK